MTSPSFRTRILNAGLWTAGGFAAQKAFQLVSNLILTRLLFPEAFGLMALANVVMIALGMFSDIGIKPAIVQSPRGEEEDFLNTAWTLQVIRGFLMWGGACLFAYPASLAYGHAILFPLISVIGCTAAINGFSSISQATAERRLNVQRLTLIQLAGQVITLTITALLVWQFRSVWALAGGGIAGVCTATLLSHICLPRHCHRLMLEPTAAHALVRFGRWIFFSTALTFTAGHGLRMLQGLLLTPSQLGVLSIAQTIAAIPNDLAVQVVMIAAFPALCEARKDSHERMVEVLRNLHGKILAFATAAFAGIALVAIPFINLLYDPRYAEAGPQVVLLALGSSIATIALLYQNAVIAIGDTRRHAAFMVMTTSLRIAGMLIGFKLYGMTGLLLGIAAGSFGGYLYVVYHARRLGLWMAKTDLFGFAGLVLAGAGIVAVYGLEALLQIR